MIEPDLLSLFIAQFQEWWPSIEGFFEGAYWWVVNNLSFIKMISFFISGVVLLGVIIYFKKVVDEVKKYRNLKIRDFLGLGSKNPVKYLKRWNKIEQSLESGEKGRLREAVIEARHIFDNLLDESGYLGESIEIKIKRFAKAEDFEEIDDLLKAESFSSNLENSLEQGVDNKKARELISVYRKAINEILEVED